MRQHSRLIAIGICCLIALWVGGVRPWSTTPALHKTPATAIGLKDTAEQLANDVFKGKAGSSYRYVASSCQALFTKSQWTELVRRGGGSMALFGNNIRVGAAATRNVTATTGEATITIYDNDAPLADVPWLKFVYEAPTWRFADCAFLTDTYAELVADHQSNYR